MTRWVMAICCALMLCSCERGCGGYLSNPMPSVAADGSSVDRNRENTYQTCPTEEPAGFPFWFRAPLAWSLVIEDLVVPSGYTVHFLFKHPDGRVVDLDDEPRQGGNLGVYTTEGNSSLRVVVTAPAPGEARVEFTLMTWRDHRHTLSSRESRSKYVERRPVVLEIVCTPPSDDPIEEDLDVVWDFEIPPEVMEDDTVCTVADKEQGACVAVGTEEEQQPFMRALRKMVTPFFRNVSHSEVGMFVRNEARTEATLITNYWPLTEDDAAPPASVSPYATLRDLFRIELATGKTWRLTSHREDGHSVTGAWWSPSGDRIAYTLMDFTDPIYPMELRVLDPALDVSVVLTDRVRGAVTWSPDGQTIAFVAGNELWAIDADGTNERRLFSAHDVLPYAVEFLERG